MTYIKIKVNKVYAMQW